MNASLLCVAALLTGAPTEAPQVTVYRPVSDPAYLVRGQNPGPSFQPPVTVAPGGGVLGPEVAGPTFAAPPTASPFPGGQIIGGEPLPPSTVITPGVDPFLPNAGPAIAPFAPRALGGHYFGYEAVFVKPYFSQNAAFGGTNAAPGTNEVQNEFDWDLEYSPRVWIGYSSADGLGARIRYWHFNEDASESALANNRVNYFALFPTTTNQLGGVATNGQRIAANQDLELNVFDTEATWHREKEWGSFTASAGIRYARIETGYAATVFNGNMAGSFLRSHREFEGAGPSLSLLGRRRLWNSNLALFASGRFSLLYGDHELNVRGSNAIANIGQNSRFGRTSKDFVPVTEFQLGAEWSRPCRWFGGSSFFLRAALESQVWFNAGSGLGTSNTGAFVPAEETDLGFFGFSFGGGWAF